MTDKIIEEKENISNDLKNDSYDSDSDLKFNNAVNAAIKTHLRRSLSKDLPDLLARLLDERGVSSKNKESVEMEEVEDEEEIQVSKPVIKKSYKGNDSQSLKEVEKLRAELKAEKQLSRQKEVMADVKSHLSGKVRPEALEMALKLISHDQMVQVQKDGSVIFKYDDEEYNDLSEGVAAWMKSKEASVLLLPPNSTSKKDIKKPGFKPLIRNDKNNANSEESIDPSVKTLEIWARNGFKL